MAFIWSPYLLFRPEYHRQKNERMKALRAQTKADKAAAKPESKKAKADAKPQMPAYEGGCLLRLTGALSVGCV